jgi:LmbE family N-acetylglucosaminyl deacetylase
MKALVVVAHDDDAVLWMGGIIHRLSDWNWHVISMCNQGNDMRRHYFARTCRELGVRADALDFLDYQDSNTAAKKNSIADMKQSLLQVVGAKKYDSVFTHSRDPNGEYGNHANHYEVCKVVRSLVAEVQLVKTINRLAFFCYYPVYRLPGLGTVARQDAQYYYQLSYGDLACKVELIRSHVEAIVNNLEQDLGAPCPNPEAFEGDGLILPAPFIGRPV